LRVICVLEVSDRGKHPDACSVAIDVFPGFEGKAPSIHPSALVLAQKVARWVLATHGPPEGGTPTGRDWV